jgi:hypothetical protein
VVEFVNGAYVLTVMYFSSISIMLSNQNQNVFGICTGDSVKYTGI